METKSNLADSQISEEFKMKLVSVEVTDEHISGNDNRDGFTCWTGALSVLSTIIGGGIVGLPYAFLILGIPLATIVSLGVIYLMQQSAYLYISARDIMPGDPQSVIEMGYRLYGRSAIFMVASILLIQSLGLCALYYIIFGDTVAQFVGSYIGKQLDESFLSSRALYILIVGFFLLFLIFRKEMTELKVAAALLFGCVCLFVVLNVYQLFFDADFVAPEPSPEYWRPDSDSGKVVLAFPVLFVAFAYLANVFPIYSNLKVKTKANFMLASTSGQMIALTAYLIVAITSIYMFGETLADSVLKNIGSTFVNGKLFWEGQIVQWAFNLVLVCHIPFVFYFGKEALLIIIDEIDRKSVSQTFMFRAQEEAKEMTAVSASKAARLAYKDMNPVYYTVGTLVYFLLGIGLAIATENIGTMFNYIAAFSVTFISFIWPGMFYLSAARKFPNANRDSKCNRVMAYIALFMGLVNFSLGMWGNFKK